MSEQINNPHDQYFRAVFSRPHIAKGFLTNFLSAEMLREINPDSLEATQESFVDEDLKPHHSDLLLRFEQADGESGFVYILLEHKSYADRRVALQILRYVMRIWEKFSNTQSGKLPPVLPIVVYHGEKNWTISREFADLVKNAEKFGDFIPNFRYGLWDLSDFDADEIKSEIFLRVVVLVMQNIYDEEFAEKVDELWQLYRLKEEAETIEFLAITVRYILAANRYVSNEDIRQSLRRVLPEWEERIMTTATREWIQKGIEQGIERGSRMQTEKLVFQILEKKFGVLTENEQTEIKSLSVENLETLALDSMDFAGREDFEEWLNRRF